MWSYLLSNRIALRVSAICKLTKSDDNNVAAVVPYGATYHRVLRWGLRILDSPFYLFSNSQCFAFPSFISSPLLSTVYGPLLVTLPKILPPLTLHNYPSPIRHTVARADSRFSDNGPVLPRAKSSAIPRPDSDTAGPQINDAAIGLPPIIAARSPSPTSFSHRSHPRST